MTDEVQITIDKSYKTLLSELKQKINSAQMRAALAVNKELIALYWNIGKEILLKQKEKAWGSKFIETLSRDLQNAFPETSGFSVRNLERMRQFAKLCPSITPAQSVPQLPWGHIVLLNQKVKVDIEREWYAQQSLSQGWSRLTLETSIAKNLYRAQALPNNKISNFLERLPSPQSEIAQDFLKSPYNFDFLGLHKDAHEREVEHASIEHITKFLLELGKGFAFVGRQVPIELDDEEYFIDMLFYHLKLHCYVVIELKATKFKPEHAGQLNFYLNLVDDRFKTSQDGPTIGILLCKSRKKMVAEYSLKGIEKPIGVSEYQLTKAIPDNLKTSLPSIEEIEQELSEPEMEMEN